tara:strand:- start:342 stop:1016 length:675 start_codon:yes stop_codon:yes gene_type:complete
MNKKYKLIFLNNENQQHYSISLNWLSSYVILVISLLILLFFIFGVFRFIKPHANQEIVNDLYFNKKEIENILFTMQNNNSDSTLFDEYQLALIPNNPPVDGIVTKGLIINSEHNGIDIATKSNAKVKAAQQGMVIFSNILNDYGKTVMISHPNNYFSIYSHLQKSLVKEREYVQSNEIIGYVGQTGNSNAPHLHFEIWKNHHIIDPRNLIEEYKIKDVSIEKNK